MEAAALSAEQRMAVEEEAAAWLGAKGQLGHGYLEYLGAAVMSHGAQDAELVQREALARLSRHNLLRHVADEVELPSEVKYEPISGEELKANFHLEPNAASATPAETRPKHMMKRLPSLKINIKLPKPKPKPKPPLASAPSASASAAAAAAAAAGTGIGDGLDGGRAVKKARTDAAQIHAPGEGPGAGLMPPPGPPEFDDDEEENEMSELARKNFEESRLEQVLLDSVERLIRMQFPKNALKGIGYPFDNPFAVRLEHGSIVVPPDYFVVVAEPCDLDKVKEHVSMGFYKSLDQFEQDVRLIIANSRVYHKSRLPMSKMTAQFEREVNKTLAAARNTLGSPHRR